MVKINETTLIRFIKIFEGHNEPKRRYAKKRDWL